MKRIAIIGKGNVGTHLNRLFKSSNFKVDFLSARNLTHISDSYDLILITVADTYIKKLAESVSRMLPKFKGIVAHTAGSVDISVFNSLFNNFGVVYPMQSFSKDIPINNYSDIPIFIEGSSDNVTKELRDIVSVIFSKIYVLSSEKRLILHVASVFSCNFANALYMMAEDILSDYDIQFESMRPLIRQTSTKILSHTPVDCQTGPAIRGDMKIMEKHLQLLGKYPPLQEIYKNISTYIYHKFNK